MSDYQKPEPANRIVRGLCCIKDLDRALASVLDSLLERCADFTDLPADG